SVTPSPLTGAKSLQVLTISGNSFKKGAIVQLKDLTNGGTFNKRSTFVSDHQLTVSAHFTTADAQWSVQVLQHGNNPTNVVEFHVASPQVLPQSLPPQTSTGWYFPLNYVVPEDTNWN